MNSRALMRKGEKITLIEDSSEHKNKIVFSVLGKDGEGASSVSYIVSCGKKTGRLKEFYPREEIFGGAVPLVRRKDNQLFCNDEGAKATLFGEMLLDYIGAYHTLEDAKNKAKKGNNSFNTFIPNFDILRGCDENGEVCGSAYIWTEDNNGDFETFDSYIDKVHKHPTRNPQKALYEILKTLYNLAECIKELHTAGLIHSDIKPENFGFSIRGGRYLTEQIRLFDVNSIYSIYTKFTRISGTAGYSAPEVLSGKITNQSDLYSIGAVLFNAVVLSDDIPDSLYMDEYYSRIDEIVENSKLINASPVTANVKFRTLISGILKKCLAKDLRNRIKRCDELKKDLKSACALLLPAQYEDDIDLGCEIKIIDKELNRYNESDSVFALQSLLFNHPLYENAEDTIRVSVLGFGVYGQQFLSRCLQSGQVKGKKLEVTVLTKDKEMYKKEYLSARPALAEFFEIDGEGDLSDTNYGKITFMAPHEAFDDKALSGRYADGFRKGDLNYNKELARELMFNNHNSTYVFVALGDDEVNAAVAQACSQIVSAYDLKCTVACACSDDRRRKGIVFVNMTAKAKESKNYKDIERMAFNAHFSWNSPLKLNTNIKKLKEGFAEKYNHDSSVDCVLAIRNVLHACGIELLEFTEKELVEVSEKYRTFIKNNKEVFAQLVNLEHRRWVVEKITNGWTCREDLSSCLYGPVNDKKNKKHPCIVKSRCEFDLEKYFKNKESGRWDKDKWNSPCVEDAYLDELDTVSVNLHRVFFKAAQEVRNSFSVNGEEADRIMSLIKDHKGAVLAFNEWMLCLKRVWNMDEKQAKCYDGYRDTFLDKTKVLTASERDEVSRYVKIINSKVDPIIKAYVMRDYKSSDSGLINAVPFILTHRENIKLFVPMMTGGNTERFNNVSSVTLVNPKVVTYGVYLKEQENIKEVIETTQHILSYMEKKEIKSAIKFAVIYNENNKKILQGVAGLIDTLKNMNPRIRQVLNLPVDSEADIAAVLTEKVDADAFENNSAYLSALLVGAGFYRCKPEYSFDSSDKKFITTPECSWLKYIRSGQFITVSDMLSFKNSAGTMETLPEYSEYNALWNLYTINGVNSYAWKDMCAVLDRYAQTNDLIATFYLNSDLENAHKLEFVIPTEVRDSYNYIISYLRDTANVLTQDSTIEYKTTDSCKAMLYVGVNNVDAVRKLFSNPYALINKRDLHIRQKPRKVEILRNNTVVSGLDMSDYPDYADKKKYIGNILGELQNQGYIYNLINSDNQEFSFVYSTRQAKELMTNAGRILEIYVYHKLQESGFDDVVSGYEVNWCDTQVKSEFDCIVTRGFRCAMIECKAQDELSQDYYYKIASLAKQFGINAVPVLIADTHERKDQGNSCNEIQRQRGSMLGVVTVCNRNHIRNIDKTLKNILSGKYESVLMRESADESEKS